MDDTRQWGRKFGRNLILMDLQIPRSVQRTITRPAFGVSQQSSATLYNMLHNVCLSARCLQRAFDIVRQGSDDR